jgi:hypothetical protein
LLAVGNSEKLTKACYPSPPIAVEEIKLLLS